MIAIQHVLQAFGIYLKATIPEIQSVIVGFPTTSDKMKIPQVTLYPQALQPEIRSSYVVKQINQPDGLTAEVFYCLGSNDLPIQVDVWAGDKKQRMDIVHKIFRALNPDPEIPSLKLTLPDYYGEIASYDMDRISDESNEIGSQTGVWRTTITVTANFRTILPKMEKIITSVDNSVELEISETVEV